MATAQAYLGAAAQKAAEAKEAYGPTIAEKLGELKVAGTTKAQSAYEVYMAKSEVSATKKNMATRASISAPIAVKDDDEIE